MTKDDLLALAERCEKATRPNDILDTAIDEAVNAAKRAPIGGRWNTTPYFTASLDAAMTLVPEGWFVRVTSAGNCDIANSAWLAEEGNQQSFYVDATTPALALCAASLRARANQGANNG